MLNEGPGALAGSAFRARRRAERRAQIWRARRWLLTLTAVGLALSLAGGWAGRSLVGVVGWVESLGSFAPAAFVIACALCTLVFIPVSILTVASGALFGVAWGTVYSFLGELLGAGLAFAVARYFRRNRAMRRLARDPRFHRIDRAIGERGFRVVLLLRLSPVVPFAIANYALGLTRVRFADYALGTIGVLPPTWLYVYNGKLAGDVVRVGIGGAAGAGPATWAVLALGVAATVLVSGWLAGVARRALR